MLSSSTTTSKAVCSSSSHSLILVARSCPTVCPSRQQSPSVYDYNYTIGLDSASTSFPTPAPVQTLSSGILPFHHFHLSIITHPSPTSFPVPPTHSMEPRCTTGTVTVTEVSQGKLNVEVSVGSLYPILPHQTGRYNVANRYVRLFYEERAIFRQVANLAGSSVHML